MKSNSKVGDILAFLRLLAANNDRPWFKARKAEFDALRQPWVADVERLIAVMSDWDDKLRGLPVNQSVYRIYRDTRFSPDKTPYKRHFAAAMGKGGRHCVSSAYYLHIEPGASMLCGGVWWPEKDKLNAIRHLIDAEQEEFLALATDKRLTSLFQFENEALRRVPVGYPQDHPLAEYLKMKSFILVKHLDDSYFDCDDWVERVNNDFKVLKPIHDFFDYVYDEI